MKRLTILIGFILFGVIGHAQVQYLPPAYVPNDISARITLGVPYGTIIYAGDMHVPYICLKEIGGNTMTMLQAINGGYLMLSPYSVTVGSLWGKQDTTRYRYELTADAQNNLTVPTTLHGYSLVFYNGSLVGNALWTGKGTAVLHFKFATKRGDKIIVQL